MTLGHRILTDIANAVVDLRERQAETERRLANVMRPGTVLDVDHEKGLAKVKVGDLESQWLPWMEQAGAIKTWTPPSKGQQVHLFSPSGEPGQGWIFPGGFSDANKQPHDKAGEHKIKASGKIILDAPVIEIAGHSLVQITGTSLKHNARNIGDTHKHEDVTPGTALTGLPT